VTTPHQLSAVTYFAYSQLLITVPNLTNDHVMMPHLRENNEMNFRQNLISSLRWDSHVFASCLNYIKTKFGGWVTEIT